MQKDDALLSETRLLFHVEHPSYHEVWLEGYEEGLNDAAEPENPYPPESKEYHFWEEGCWAAFYGEAPLFDLEGNVLSEMNAIQAHAVQPAEQAAANDQRKQAEHESRSKWAEIAQLSFATLFGTATAVICYELVA